ncbi:MAG: hypothetical protein N3F63_03390 [Thermoplasmata archaeon]|nr:hypothetical protein [Thermoplasmata archaeon]
MYEPPGGVVLRPQRRPLERKYTSPHHVISPYKGPPPRLLLPKFMLAIFLAIGLTACGAAVYIIYDSRIELGRIECDVKEMRIGKEYLINVTCYDFKNRPLRDVRVHIEGASIDETKISDENGKVQFNVTPLLPMNVHNDIVRISAFHPHKPEIVCTASIAVHD